MCLRMQLWCRNRDGMACRRETRLDEGGQNCQRQIAMKCLGCIVKLEWKIGVAGEGADP